MCVFIPLLLVVILPLFVMDRNVGLRQYLINLNLNLNDSFQCNTTDLPCLASNMAVNNTLVTCILDSPYVDMFLNFAESAKNRNITNLLPVTLSKYSNLQLTQRGYDNYYDDSIVSISKQESSFMSGTFKKKGAMKFVSSLQLLKLGYSVLLLDLDTFFVKNPFNYFRCKDCDFEVQMNVPGKPQGLCVGIVFFRATKAMKKFLFEMNSTLNKNPNLWDQALFLQMARDWQRLKKIKYNVLPFEQFPTGYELYERIASMETYNRVEKSVIYHNNWSLGLKQKLNRAKELGIWLLDYNGYYSNKSAKYITYDNPDPAKIKQELNVLTQAFKLAEKLNRTLILPLFTCPNNHKLKCTFEQINEIKQQAMKHNGKFREHFFLRHPKVPPVIKNSYTKPIFVQVKTAAGNNLYKNINMTQCKIYKAEKESPTYKEILMWTKNYEQVSVIKFHNLYFHITD